MKSQILAPTSLMGNPTAQVLSLHANVSCKTLMKLANQMKKTKTWKKYEDQNK
jgi:hypothetical protein